MKIVIGIACLIASMAQAHAANVQFHILNSSPYNIQVRFFSKTRGVTWPGPHSGWNQNDHAVHDYNLSCNPGERICYGAWSMPNLADKWGVGVDSKLKYKKCCGTCG